MDKDQYTEMLENVVKQMLRSLRNIPFNIVIESISGKKVISFDFNNQEHVEVLNLLKKAALIAGKEMNKEGILRTRPNEVGNDIEQYTRKALSSLGLKADIPASSSGRRKSTGYPDIIFWYNEKPYYLECKTYNIENITSTQRSFYLSPSDEFKVTHDAVHFVLSYEIYEAGIKGHRKVYKCKHYKILSIENLSVDLKYEFNSDNKRLYSGRDGAIILHEEDID